MVYLAALLHDIAYLLIVSKKYGGGATTEKVTEAFKIMLRNPKLQAILVNIFGGIITQVQLVIFVSVIVIMIALGIFLKKSLFGKSVEAISDNEQVAKIVGIDTEKVISRVFVIGSAIAGLVGVYVGYDTGLEPTMGMNLLLKGVIASIIGGIGNVYGGVLGAFLLGFVENFGIWKISGEWKDAIAFVLLIVFLLVRPQGILKK